MKTRLNTKVFEILSRALLTLLLLYVLIEGLAQYGLPHAAAVANAMLQLFQSGTLKHDIAVTLARWAVGFSLGIGIGIGLGLLTGRSRVARFSLEWFLTFALRTIPYVALGPIVQYVFGFSEAGKFFLIAYVTASVVWITVHNATRDIPEDVIWQLDSMNISTWRKLRLGIIPSISRSIYSALRIILTISINAAVFSELLGVIQCNPNRPDLTWCGGVGYLVNQTYEAARYNEMLAVVVVLGAVALVGDRLLIALWDGMGWLRAQWAARKVQKLLASLPTNPHTPTRGELQALHVRELSAGYPNKPIISNMSLSVPAGHTLAIVGPSGCGKTTLLHAIAGMRADGLHVTGEVTLGSKKIARGDIGAVIHDPLRFGDLTTWEYSMLGIQNPTHEDLLRNRDRLEAFGLLQDAHRPVRDLSKGQQQRADIAKALASQPKLLLMDEPFGALDDITRSELHTFFWDHVRGRSTIIFVTHNIREAIYLGDSVQVGVDANAFTLDTRSSESPEERMSPDERSLLAAIRKLKNGRHS